MLAPYWEDKVWENSQSLHCCDLSLTLFTLPIVHFGLGMQHATKHSPTFFELAVYKRGQGLRVAAQIVLAIVYYVKTIHRTTIEQ